ncbi:MAG: hypothetical protein WBA97_33180 [Actinophytocola sp.]|uniref:Rv0361 family membrane protein n=1 Tax=Actinophytocola sp. TaxID=1872138 RepID=UPI003C7200BC
MTYPPQQPGPYGPQDPYGQQNPYGQQPPQYGAPQYGAPQWGQQPGYPAGPPPKKSRTGLIVTLVIVAVLVVGGGVTAFLLLKDDGGSGGGSEESPRVAADTYAKELGAAVSTKPEDASLDKVKPVMCASDYKELNGELQEAKKDEEEAGDQPSKTTFTIANFKEEGEGATFDMTQKRGDDERDPLNMNVKKEDDHWVVCGLYDDSQGNPGEESTAPRSSESEDSGPTDGSIPNPIPKPSN